MRLFRGMGGTGQRFPAEIPESYEMKRAEYAPHTLLFFCGRYVGALFCRDGPGMSGFREMCAFQRVRQQKWGKPRKQAAQTLRFGDNFLRRILKKG